MLCIQRHVSLPCSRSPDISFPLSRRPVPEVPTPCSRSPVALYPISRWCSRCPDNALWVAAGFPETDVKLGLGRARGPRGSRGCRDIGNARPPAAASGVVTGVQLAGEAVKAPLVIPRRAADVISEPGIVFALDGVDVEPGKITADQSNGLLG